MDGGAIFMRQSNGLFDGLDCLNSGGIGLMVLSGIALNLGKQLLIADNGSV